MAGLCEGDNEPPGSLKAISAVMRRNSLRRRLLYGQQSGVLYLIITAVDLATIFIVMIMIIIVSTLISITTNDGGQYGIRSNEVVVITEDVQNVHLLLEYRPHIDVSLTCEHDPKLQEYCVCPQNMPQFDSEGIPNQAPETNKPMILNGPTSRNREGSDQVSVEAKQFGHLYLSSS
ncbi:hypothetical protein ANN_26366 [Periplaneta americana]|uniref:Uncharacterized protein n=1 Tax=Periplaneta americana TaxID=6978 RepID=A0ABQ8RXV4_PERAM|nr:hypothetical protein ANN_26366 [Periplaneta americana]